MAHSKTSLDMVLLHHQFINQQNSVFLLGVAKKFSRDSLCANSRLKYLKTTDP